MRLCRYTPLFALALASQAYAAEAYPAKPVRVLVGTIAIEIASQAAPDGYTLLALSAQNVAGMVSKPGSVDLAKAFAPAVQMVILPYLLVVTPSLPVNSVKELIAPGKVKPLIQIINRDVYNAGMTGCVVQSSLSSL
jgi:hypothetical protein